MKNFYIVILAGGEGTRFVPYSTPERPKQFLPIVHPSRTMIQLAFDRICALVPAERCLISTNERYASLVREQLPSIPEQNILLEPCKKNTAPAMALATRVVFERNRDVVVLFMPSDHFMAEETKACDIFRQAYEYVLRNDVLVTFVVPPDFPSTEYGYLLCDSVSGNHGHYRVLSFVEKPDLNKAKEYVSQKNYFWNSGLFLWKGSVFLRELEKYLPETFQSLTGPDFDTTK